MKNRVEKKFMQLLLVGLFFCSSCTITKASIQWDPKTTGMINYALNCVTSTLIGNDKDAEACVSDAKARDTACWGGPASSFIYAHSELKKFREKVIHTETITNDSIKKISSFESKIRYLEEKLRKEEAAREELKKQFESQLTIEKAKRENLEKQMATERAERETLSKKIDQLAVGLRSSSPRGRSH